MTEGPFNLPSYEEEVLRFWRKQNIFEKSLELAKHAKRFVFFEGPPSANAKPGLHHVLSRVYKDLFARFKSMCGFLVERKAGWDTHGLPIEVQLEKELGLKNKKEIEQYGVGKFNHKAQDLVWRYKHDWEKMTERIGFWLDQKHPYITYEWRYMESLWWIIKEVSKQRLLFQDYKVVPWCTRCGTALASHEVAQGYKTVQDNSVYIKFKLKEGQKIGNISTTNHSYILSWTTTPWTLPGNVALAVGEKIDYTVLEDEHTHEQFIVAKDLMQSVFDLSHLKESVQIKGKALVGISYEPLFDIPALHSKTSYKIYDADFVTTQDGTGVVHTAVMYGEEDYELGKKVGLPQHHTVQEEGYFTDEVAGFSGMHVKDKITEEKIISYLKERGVLFTTKLYEHEYPFCWRCDSPLLYFAHKSWFVGMSKLRKKLVANNKKINWIPSHIKEGRFGVWLKEVKDWAFSRNRYWGTPLPIWVCEKCNHRLVVGSLGDLTKYRYKKANTYILVRHGDTDLNEQKILNSDHTQKGDMYGLNTTGVRQIQTLALKLKNRKIDLIVASDLQRTKETAEIIAQYTNAHVVYDKRLREVDVGKLEGQSYEKLKSLFPNVLDRFEHSLPSGENLRKVRSRVMDLYLELERSHEGKVIMFVSHGDPLWMLETALLGLSDEASVSTKVNYPQKGEMKEIISLNWPYNEKGELDLHRPFIDEIFLRCQKCKGKSVRVSEVVDVWFDSGAMPFAQWHWPFEHKGRIGGKEHSFPADFISEGIDQTRGWFYSLLAVATLLGYGAPYRNVISLAHVLDKQGQKMSKSKGNVIDPEVMIQKYGADALRWYFFTVNQAGEYKLFDETQFALRSRNFVRLLWNSWVFFDTYGRKRFKKTATVFEAPKKEHILDVWLTSYLNETVRSVRGSLEAYDATSAGRTLEKFIDDVSNWYIRRSRDRFARPLDAYDYERAQRTIGEALYKITLLLAPFMPFMSEVIYQNIRRYSSLLPFDFKESVHLCPYPMWQKNFTQEQLLVDMNCARELVSAIHGLRDQAKIKVRQPLREAYCRGGTFSKLPDSILSLVAQEVNVKYVRVVSDIPKEPDVFVLETPFGVVGLLTSVDEALREEGYIRELIRNIQEMRKTIGLKADEFVHISITSTPSFLGVVKRFSSDIEQKTQSKAVEVKDVLEGSFDIERDFVLGEHHIRIALKK